MLARSARCGVLILGLLALCLPLGAHFVLAAPAPCTGRHDVVFSTKGDSASQTIVAALACATSRVRGLTARTPVTVRLVDAATLRAEVGQISQEDTATQPLTGTTIALQLLGALGPRDDLAAIRRGQYSLTTASEYDYHTKTLFIRAANGHFTPLDRAIIAHEYTRALQDQYFNLSNLLSSTGSDIHNSDALLARQAVVEGDAINTMIAVATATFTRQENLWLNQQLQRPAKSTTDFPHDLYGFPAAQGTNFVKAVMQAAAKGKHGDAALAASNIAVNQALTNPPVATAEIVNSSLYLQHAQPGDPVPPLPTVDLGVDWAAVDSDVLGSFGIGDLLKDHSPQAAAQADAQWQSDRWSAYQRGGDTIMLWRARFSSAAGAQAFVRAFTAFTAARFHTTLKAQPSIDWQSANYALSVREQGGTVAVSVGSNKDLLPLCTYAAGLLVAS